MSVCVLTSYIINCAGCLSSSSFSFSFSFSPSHTAFQLTSGDCARLLLLLLLQNIQTAITLVCSMQMHFMVEMPSKLILLMLSVVTMIAADCDNSIAPELTFRLGGNNLDWPCSATKNIYTTSNRYIPKSIIATRSQIYRDTAFVAIPRYRNGVPFTLGRVDLRKGKCSVAMAPYPCWASQEEGNCQALQNVVDIFLDRQV